MQDIRGVGLIPGLERSPGGGHEPTPVFLPGEAPWTEAPGRLPSMVLQRVGHDWSDLACSMQNPQEASCLKLGAQRLEFR